MSVTQNVADGVLVLTIDNPPVNASSQAVRAGLSAGIERLTAADRTGEDLVAAVIIGAGGSFVAGSDISEFDGPIPAPLLPAVIAAIEACPRPVVAALDGMALGGGLELALGCDARVATPRAQVGLPEVTLGMVPGAGGTQRLPRLTGRVAAIDLIVSGRRIGAAEAHDLGIVDEVVDGDLLTAACTAARTVAKRPTATLPVPDEDPAAVEAAATTAVRRSRPNALEAVELVRSAGNRPVAEGLAIERATFDRLRTGPEAAALRHVFFAERSAPRRRGVRAASDHVTRAGVVGAGAMGVGIATALALRGIAVHLVDADAEQAGRATDAVRQQLARAARRERRDDTALARAQAAVTASAEIADLAGSQIVIEAVFEDAEVKTAVLRAAAEAAPGAVLATNTSYLGVDRLADALPDPSVLVGLHFFNPAAVMRLVEVVAGPRSAQAAVATGVRLVKDIGKCAVLAGDAEGFVGNRIFAVYRRHAEYLLEDGALPEQVDAALQEFGLPMGPFAVSDLAGLQIAQALRTRWRETGRLPTRYVEIPDRLCELGRLGRRTSAGYYAYDADGRQSVDEAVTELVLAESARKGIVRRPLSTAEIVDRTIGAMVVEAARAVADGTAAHADDVDVALVNGFGFPRHLGGPMWWARQQTPERLRAITTAVAEAAHEPDRIELVQQVLGGVPA